MGTIRESKIYGFIMLISCTINAYSLPWHNYQLWILAPSMVCGQIRARYIIFNAIKFPTRQNAHINVTSTFQIAVYTLRLLRLLRTMNSSTYTHMHILMWRHTHSGRVCVFSETLHSWHMMFVGLKFLMF